jgi:thiol-disulfide isomerase/thioredoxin
MVARLTKLLVATLLLSLPAAAQSVWHDLSARTLDGRVFEAPDLRGRVVLLDFWATWCAPCLEELPTLETAYRKYSAEDFVLIGVSMDQGSRRTLTSWLRRHEVEWPQLHDGRGFDGEWARKFGVEAVPRSVVIDREGKIIALDLRGPVLLTALRDLLQD